MPSNEHDPHSPSDKQSPEENSTENNDERGDNKQKPASSRDKNSSRMFFPIFLCALALMFVFFFMGKRPEIPYSKLMELIDKGPAVGNAEVFVIVEEGLRDNKRQVKYSDLDNIVVGDSDIYATVTREVLKTATSGESRNAEKNFSITSGRRGFVEDGGSLLTRLEKSGFTFRSNGYDFWGENGLWLLMLAVMFGFFLFLMRSVGGAGAVAFSRNRGRLVSQEDTTVTFDDVAGVDEAVEELKEIVDFLKTPEKFQALGGRIPRGVLLVGPPGTGKTILAKAVAGEADVPFFSLSGSDFVELYVGVGAARVRDLFTQAAKHHRCIIFIDELDAIGKTRDSSPMGSHEERNQTLNALLVEMDGFDTNAGLIVMAATNRPEILDAALLRPGRFDRQVLVDRPDLLGREAILKVHAKNVKIDESVTLKDIASITPGFVGADLAALINEAALLAARAGKDCVTMDEFNEGVERVTTGLQKKQRVIRPDEKKRIAVHECGHALVAFFTPQSDKVHKVSIIPRGLAALGYTLQRPEEDRYLMTKKELEARIQTLLAGTIAEEMEFEDVSTGAQNDLERATSIARGMVMDYGMSELGRVTFRENTRANFLGDSYPTPRSHSEKMAWEIDQAIRGIIDTLFDQTRQLLHSKKDILERLTERLLEKEIIETEELAAVIENREWEGDKELREFIDEAMNERRDHQTTEAVIHEDEAHADP